MASIFETDGVMFQNLLFFEREVINPSAIKKELDTMMTKLRKIGVAHKNIVISKVIQVNRTKKTMIMQVRVPIDMNDQLMQFLYEYPQYKLESFFMIRKGLKLIVSNDEEDFSSGIQQLMKLRQGIDMSNNPIIELSRISFDGRVLGFELFYEDDNKN